MAVSLNLAGIDIPTDAAALKSLNTAKELAFALSGGWEHDLATPLGSLPATVTKTSVAYTSPAASWNPAGSPITFGLQGGASGSFEVVTTGSLVSYTDGLDSPAPVAVNVPPSTCYTRLTLCFTISANAAGTFSGAGGAYGVKASLDTTETYAICFCKRFDPSIVLRDAISQGFESFVLPFGPETLTQMSDGDHLLHEFDGCLHLGFGAYAGLNKVLYCAQTATDVLHTFGSPLATVSTAVSPTASLSTELDLTFKYQARFEALLSKQGATGKLHLFRSSQRNIGAKLTAGLTFDSNITASVASHGDTLKSSIAHSLGADAQGLFDSVWSAASGAVDSYTSEANDKVASWLGHANGIQTNLELAIEQTHDRTLLTGYIFDLSNAGFPAAWKMGIDGDFVSVLKLSGVTLDTGSGLEQMYRSKTSVALNLFNLWHWTSWSDFLSKSSLIYAGNNVFHLTANIGRQTETDAVGTMRSLNLYFSALADTNQDGTASQIVVDLHLDLTSKGDKGAMNHMAGLLNAANCGPACGVLAREMGAFATNSPSGTAQLKITIPQSAYAALRCDSYVNGKPSGSTANDEGNWNAFAAACNDLKAWPLNTMSTLSAQASAFLVTFNAWEEWNIAANGSTAPDRRHPGNRNVWPDNFPQNLSTEKGSVINALLAGQQFMNFCEDLRNLFALSDGTAAAVSWTTLLQEVTDAIKLDNNIDFARPTALALIRLCQRAATTAQGPMPPAVPTNHLCVTLTV